MSRIKWGEVFKFLSGAALAGSFTTFYLWLGGISVPFLGRTISSGTRSAIQRFTSSEDEALFASTSA